MANKEELNNVFCNKKYCPGYMCACVEKELAKRDAMIKVAVENLENIKRNGLSWLCDVAGDALSEIERIKNEKGE